MVFILTTERLILRPLTTNDREWFISLHQDPRVMCFAPRGPLSKEMAELSLKQAVVCHKLRSYGPMACCLNEQPIGFCGICLRELEGVLYPELGYRLFPQYWSMGYATEAALAVKNDGFIRLRLPLISSFIHPDNVPSIRVAEKIGEKFSHHAAVFDKIFSIYTVIHQEGLT